MKHKRNKVPTYRTAKDNQNLDVGFRNSRRNPPYFCRDVEIRGEGLAAYRFVNDISIVHSSFEVPIYFHVHGRYAECESGNSEVVLLDIQGPIYPAGKE